MKYSGYKPLKSAHLQPRQKHLTLIVMPLTNGGRVRTIKAPCWAISCLFAATVLAAVYIGGLTVINGYAGHQLEKTLVEKEVLLTKKNKAEIAKSSLLYNYNNQQSDFDRQIDYYSEQVINLEARLIEMEKLAAESYSKMNAEGSPVSSAPAASLAETHMGGNYLPDDSKGLSSEERLDSLISAVSDEFDNAEDFISQYAEDTSAFADFKASLPSIWPVTGVVTSEAGSRTDPINGSAASHTGIDIKADIGTAVSVTADGTVKSAGLSSGYGYLVIIDHGYGYETYYAHNSKLLVSAGDRVSRGDIIALSGNTGRTTGPHVHYEVRYNGEIKNPRDFFKS